MNANIELIKFNIELTLDTIKVLKSKTSLDGEDIETIIMLQAELASLLDKLMNAEHEDKVA